MTPWDIAFKEAGSVSCAVVVEPEDFSNFKVEILETAKRWGFQQVPSDMPDEVLFSRVH